MSLATFKRVLQWETDKEQECASQFQLAQRHHHEQRQKLQGLQQYRVEYLRQIQQAGSAGVQAGALTHQQAFVSQLDRACEQQLHIIAQAKKVADQRKTQWLAQQKKRKAMEQLIHKKQLHLAAKETRLEQQLMDEVALQRFMRARSAS